MIVAGTGHRPDKLGGYDDETAIKLTQFAIDVLRAAKPTAVISGMALGWDMALARAAIILKIPLWAYIPFEGQESRWPPQAQERYRATLAAAEKVVVCSPGGYGAQKMQVRNQRMVDDCNKVLALWNGTSGGTANCLRYAEAVDRPVENLWTEWMLSY